MKIPLPSDFIAFSGMKQASNRLASNDANQPRCLLRQLQPLVQVSRYTAGVVPVDASIRPTPFSVPLILPVAYRASPNPFTIRHNPHRSKHDPQKVYPPLADEPYMQSLSRSGLLESRIETTLQIVSILICWAAQRVVNYDDSS